MEEWKTAAEHNSNKRLNWTKIIGTSLSKYVAGEHAKGKNKEEIIKDIWNKALVQSTGETPERLIELVRIGVSARLGEMESERTGFKNGLIQLAKYKAIVRTFPDGKKFIYVSPRLEFDGEVVVTLEKEQK